MIDKEMTIDEILSRFASKAQKIAQEMASFGLHCVGCGAASYETLEAGAFGHGMSDEEFEKLLKRLNAIVAEPVSDPEQITLTPRAAEKVKEILVSENKQGYALRFGDKPGGCGGYEYTLEFSKELDDMDCLFLSQGIDIHMKKEAKERLLGCEIDYVDGLMGGGFKISNPNAKSSCSCGSSQSY